MAVLRNKKGFTRKRDWVQIRKDIKNAEAFLIFIGKHHFYIRRSHGKTHHPKRKH